MGWRPIETAPRDGTPILLCQSQTSLCGYASPHRGPRTIVIGSYGEDGENYWKTANAFGGRSQGGGDNQFTHWMPLPELPATTERAWRMTVGASGTSFDLMKVAAEHVLERVVAAKSYRHMPMMMTSGADGGPSYAWSCKYTCPAEDRIVQLRQEADRIEARLRGNESK